MGAMAAEGTTGESAAGTMSKVEVAGRCVVEAEIETTNLPMVVERGRMQVIACPTMQHLGAAAAVNPTVMLAVRTAVAVNHTVAVSNTVMVAATTSNS